MSILNGLKGGFAIEKKFAPTKRQQIELELKRVSLLVPNANWEIDDAGRLFVNKNDFPVTILETPEEVYIARGDGRGTDLHLISGKGEGYVVKGIVRQKVYSTMVNPS